MIWGRRNRDTTAVSADRTLVKVLENLAAELPKGASFNVLREAADKFSRSSSEELEERFVPLYLMVEQSLAHAEGEVRKSRGQIRNEIRTQFPGLPLSSLLAPIFASESMQERLLQKKFLEELIAAGFKLLGGAGQKFLLTSSRNLEELPDLLPPESPLTNLADRPARLEDICRSVCSFLSANLGDSSARKLLEFAYERTSSLYVGLERFPVVLRLLPENLLDHEKIALLSRDQMERTLMENLRELGVRNEQLAEVNHQLVFAQAELEDVRSGLEVAVEQQTRELAHSESLFRAVTDSVPDSIVAVNAKGNLIAWNAGAERMFGYSPDEIREKVLSDLMPERYRERHEMGLARIAQGAESRLVGKTLALHGLRKDNSEFPLDLTIGIWALQGERFFSGVMRDTTERALAERRNDELREQLRQSQKMDALGRLAGGVAHDFNNVLTVIRGNADLLLDEAGQTDSVSEGLKEIRSAADHAAELTSQLLAVSRTQPHRPRKLDLCAQVRELEPMLRRVIEERIQLHIDSSSESCNVTMDSTQAMQVVLNLAINAKDAMPHGGTLDIATELVTLTPMDLRNQPGKPAGNYVRLRVGDTGEGIAKDVVSRIFEPFFTAKPGGAGTGLGLSVVYGIVEQASGFIEIDSNAGAGARFDVYLPESSETVAIAPADSKVTPSGGNEFILLVEDQPNLRALVRRILVKGGYDVVDASGGRDAFRLVAQRGYAPHLVVTDVVMPDMGGPGIVRRLVKDVGDLKVVFMSGYTGELASEEYMERAHFLPKPFSPADMLGIVRLALDSNLKVRASDFRGEGAE